MPWQNADGLTVRTPDDIKKNPNYENRVRAMADTGSSVRQLELDLNFKKLSADGGNNFTSDLNNDGTKDGYNSGDVYLPANASVLRATLVVTEAAAGGTSFTIGTYTIAGAAIVATGLFTATEGVLANVDTIGKRTYGAGALVAVTAGTAGVGTADAYVGIATTGTFTAGKARLIIEYLVTTVDA
jgi:hypothetical protein